MAKTTNNNPTFNQVNKSIDNKNKEIVIKRANKNDCLKAVDTA